MQLLNPEIKPKRSPKSDITINKLKIKNTDTLEIKIVYELPPGQTETKTVDFVCNDQPRKEFDEAIASLLPTVCDICGLDIGVWEEGAVTGITFKHKDDDFDVVITAQNKIEEFNVVVNTPLFKPTNELQDKFNNVIAEIEDYVSGKRAQLSLFEQ